MSKEPRGQELIRRYKKNYGIPENAEITEEMILKHWELEKKLTKQLLDSTPENRWDVFQNCYSTLYKELDWLNKYGNQDNAAYSLKKLIKWSVIIGPGLKDIYEIGSGKGELINYLAECGYNCKGTEITKERGAKHVNEHPNLQWGLSDGINLARFEKTGSFDVVISSQVMEHFHPDDLDNHLKNVLSLLRPGGSYIFTTPHRFMGPSDVSAVFKKDIAMCMHLKEYNYNELKQILKKNGFNDINAVWSTIPQLMNKIFNTSFKPRYSALYLSYLCLIERILGIIPGHYLRKHFTVLSIFALFEPSIHIVAKKKSE